MNRFCEFVADRLDMFSKEEFLRFTEDMEKINPKWFIPDPSLKTVLWNGKEIDVLIYPLIKLLNEKGYKTISCCSGHIYDKGSFYIEFVDAETCKRFYRKMIDHFCLERYRKYKTRGPVTCVRFVPTEDGLPIKYIELAIERMVKILEEE